MIRGISSALIWFGIAMLVIFWVPVLAVVWLFDRDPARYHTGRTFRKLGKWISRINPQWRIAITGETGIDDRRPYVMVCNHLSQADIPLISNLPWEMKWVAKQALFSVPLLGWMMRMAGDISVDRQASGRKEHTLQQASRYLEKNCSVIFFPEGTRSRTGKLNRFTVGAFELAIRRQVPVLPMVIDGTQNALPKKSWMFGESHDIRLKILEPVDTGGLQPTREDIGALAEDIRHRIRDQLMEWREQRMDEVDNMIKSPL